MQVYAVGIRRFLQMLADEVLQFVVDFHGVQLPVAIHAFCHRQCGIAGKGA